MWQSHFFALAARFGRKGEKRGVPRRGAHGAPFGNHCSRENQHSSLNDTLYVTLVHHINDDIWQEKKYIYIVYAVTIYSLHHVQEQFHKHAGTIPHCKNKRECLRKISVPYLFRYATGQQQVFTLMVHRCAAQRMTKNVYAIQKRMRPKSSALTSRARHSPHRAHYTGPPMDSFRSPMVSKYKVQKAGEKKKG